MLTLSAKGRTLESFSTLNQIIFKSGFIASEHPYVNRFADDHRCFILFLLKFSVRSVTPETLTPYVNKASSKAFEYDSVKMAYEKLDVRYGFFVIIIGIAKLIY